MDLKLHVIAHGECVSVHNLNGPKVSNTLTSWPLSDQVVLEFKNGKWFVTDNKSVLGIYLDGNKVDGSTTESLKNGSCISLGPPDSVLIKYECYFKGPGAFRKTKKNKRQKINTNNAVCSGANCIEQKNSPNHSASVEEQRVSPVRGPITRSRAVKAEIAAIDHVIKTYDEYIALEKTKQLEKRVLRGRRTKAATGKDKNEQQGVHTGKRQKGEDEKDKTYVTIEQGRLSELEDSEKKCAELQSEVVLQEKKFTNSIKEILEKCYTCAICTELYTRAVSLGCAHTFCSECLNRCMKNSKSCPVCRTPIQEQHKSVAIDNFIDSMVEMLDEDYKKHRSEIVTERKAREESRSQESSRSSTSSDSQDRANPDRNIRSAIMVLRLVSNLVDGVDSD